MLKFIHAADFHLDSAFAALPPEKAAERRREQRELPGRLAEAVRTWGRSWRCSPVTSLTASPTPRRWRP